jgi:NAD(P)-dependent dehydrogenase (short-subunit alcohol dehydrogenase family)
VIRSRLFDLSGKIALVTGAGSGIGAAVAKTLAGAGAHVFATDLNADTALATADEITREGGRSEGMQLDVRDEAACAATAERVLTAAGRLDVLVNNAGIGHVGTMMTTSGADLDALYGVNVRGVFNVTKVFVASMLARRSGSIINIASVAGVVGLPDRLAYCTSKFAVVGLTKSMALDHAAGGVRVNCVCPGRVETEFVAARLREYADPVKAYQEMSSTQAVGRMGRPEEIGPAVLYLASDEAAFVTGSAFMIDGGWKG